MSFTYLYSFVLVTKDWTLINATYFIQTQTVALTVFGIMSGFLLHYFRHYKVSLFSIRFLVAECSPASLATVGPHRRSRHPSSRCRPHDPLAWC